MLFYSVVAFSFDQYISPLSKESCTARYQRIILTAKTRPATIIAGTLEFLSNFISLNEAGALQLVHGQIVSRTLEH